MRLVRPLPRRKAASLAALLATSIFLSDLSQPLGVAVGIAFIALPLLGLLSRSRHMIIVLAVASSGLILVGMALSEPGAAIHQALLNRAMCVGLVWIVALISIRHLKIGTRLRRSLRRQVSEDPLTGLYNRRYVFNCIKRELNRYRRYGVTFSVVLIDADHFKRVNDTWGHPVGDRVLKHIASVCQNAIRDGDVAGRFGGEEFIIVLPHTGAIDAAFVAHRIRQSTRRKRFLCDGDEIRVTLSLGIAECGPGAETFDNLLQAADRALYSAKRAGRDRVTLHADSSGVGTSGEPKAA